MLLVARAGVGPDNNSLMPGTIVPNKAEEFPDATNVVKCDQQGNPGCSSDTGLDS